MTIFRDNVRAVLQTVMYPPMKDNLVSSGIVGDDLHVTDEEITVILHFPRPQEPFAKSVVKAAEAALRLSFPDVSTIVVRAAYPAAAEEEAPDALAGVKNIIAISSGKGGVGKSTIAVNVAVALARMGYRVALVDADITGPSLPTLLHAEQERIYTIEKDGRELMCPAERYGVQCLSIGFFVDKDSAVLWRGAMASNALKQMLIGNVDWGEQDFMILDTPPGTSDIHLTLLQTIGITGAVIVTTPQEVALSDARKGIDMYQNPKVNVPILGIVENMSWFTPAELPENKYYIFGRDGGKTLAAACHLPLLAQIPLVESLCTGSDAGVPAAVDAASAQGQAFLSLAQTLVTLVNRRNKDFPPTRPVATR